MIVPVSFDLFIEQLTECLKNPLPGEKAHWEMEALSAKYLDVKPDEHTRKSAVLMLLYPCGDQVCFPLILRQNYTGFHSGEVSFPGGKFEPGDKNLLQTALREANEEIGLVADDVRILGTLTELIIAPSNFMVLPVLGYIPYKPAFTPDAHEAEDVFEIQLDHFSKSENIGEIEIIIPGDKVRTPYYDFHGHKIWGATAKIINELLCVMSSNVTIKK